MWAPSVIEKGGKYYFFFGANDIQNDGAVGGIGVAVADQPSGPFKDHLGKPLIGKFHNGAQPIDQFVFSDADGTHYLIYGGWRHCNIARLNDDFTGFVPFEDGTTFKEITPEGYVEGPFMFIRDGKYYFMWSEGGWTGPDYSVAYAIADSPFGPFQRIAKVLKQDPEDRHWRRPPFGDPRAGNGRLLRRLSPSSAGRNRRQLPRHLHRSDGVRRGRLHQADPHHP